MSVGQRLKVVGGAGAMVIGMATPGIMYFEGYIPSTYRDPVGIPTACWGETGKHIQMGMEFSLDQCRSMLSNRHVILFDRLSECLSGGEVTPWEGAAILSWADNVGRGAACTSTLARMVRAGVPGTTWCQQLPRWTKATKLGVTISLPGLVIRRDAEKHMCLYGEWPTWVKLLEWVVS